MEKLTTNGRQLFRTGTRLWAYGRALAVALFVLGFLASDASRAEYKHDFSTGDWTGLVHIDDGDFNGCWLTRNYDGTRLYLRLKPGEIISLGFENETWDLGVDQPYHLELAVDGRAKRSVEAIGNESAIGIDFGEDREFISALRAGNRLRVRAGGETLSFDLKGSNDAIKRGQACVSRELRQADRSKNPFSGNSEGSGMQLGVISEADSEKVELLLLMAGLDSPTMLTLETLAMLGLDVGTDHPIFLAWLSKADGLIGFLTGWKSSAPKDEMNDVVSGFADRCDGRSATKRENFTYLKNGRKVLRAETACEEPDGLYVLNMVVVFDEDNAFLFGHRADGAGRRKAEEVSQGLTRVFGLEETW